MMENRAPVPRSFITSPKHIPRLDRASSHPAKPGHVPLQGKYAVLQQTWTPSQIALEAPTISSENKRASSAPARRSTALLNKVTHSSSRPSSGNVTRPNLRPSFYRFDNMKNAEDLTDPGNVKTRDDGEVHPDFKFYRVGEPLASSASMNFGSMASISMNERSRPPTARSIAKSHSTPLNNFRSPAIAMEVSLHEKLRELDARPQGPCPIRLQAHRELFDEIIEKEPNIGYILRQIKHEYDISGVQIQEGGLQSMYDELVQSHSLLKQEYEKLSMDNSHEHIYSKKLEEENDELLAVLSTKEREIQQLKESLSTSDPMWQHQQMLQARIDDLEQREIPYELKESPAATMPTFKPGTTYSNPKSLWVENQELGRKIMEVSNAVDQVKRKERESYQLLSNVTGDITSIVTQSKHS